MRTTNDITNTRRRHETAVSLVTGFSHAAILTADVDRLASFYCELFDADVIEVPSPPGTRSITVQLTDVAGLTLMEVPGNPFVRGSSEMLGRGHVDHLAFDAPSGAVLNRIRHRIVELGAGDGQPYDYGFMISVHFTDPDGMATEVCWLRDPTMADMHPPIPFEGSLTDEPVRPVATPTGVG